MNLQISFVETRARRSDPESSKAAAKNAAGGKAAELRIQIQTILKREYNYRATPDVPGLTAKEIAFWLTADYYDVQRRLSECANIRKTAVCRDGGMVWEWCGK